MSKEVVVDSLPKCDFCESEARYDGKTKLGPWGNMCEECFPVYGVGLGTGKGQRLVLRTEQETSSETSEEPSIEQLEEWMFDGLCETPDGRTVELDHPEGWPRLMGLI